MKYIDTILVKTSAPNFLKIMQGSKKDYKLTTWEAFNYILHGLVNEAIEVFKLDPQLKLTAFQIWTAYLRKTESAFFNDQEEVLPKLPASFKKQ